MNQIDKFKDCEAFKDCSPEDWAVINNAISINPKDWPITRTALGFQCSHRETGKSMQQHGAKE